jgi:inner membrane protein
VDPLTHTLAGVAMSESGIGRGSRHAAAGLVIGANLPDVDVLSYFAGSDAALGFRRGHTHGVLALVLWPVLLAMLLAAWDRFSRRAGRPVGERPVWVGSLLPACAIGVASHPILDWLNTYGIRLLMPFDDRWFYGDAVFIIDPWLWLMLGGAVMLARAGKGPRWWVWIALAGLTSVPVVGPAIVPRSAKVLWIVGLATLCVLRATCGRRVRSRVIARVGLVLAALYIVASVGAAAAWRSWALVELQRQGLSSVDEVMVGPTPANPFRWQLVVRSDGAYRTGTLHAWGGRRLRLRERVIPVDPDPARVEAARRSPCIAGALRWMRFPFAEVEPTADGHTVWFLDARYVREHTRGGFGIAAVELDRDLRPRDCDAGVD